MSTVTADHAFVERRTRPRIAGSRRFFQDLIVSKKVKRGRVKAILLPIAAALHVIALAAVILVPLLASEDLPSVTTAGGIRAFFVEPAAAPPPPPPPPAPPKAAAVTAPKPKVEAPKPVVEPKFVAPVETPTEVPVAEATGTEGAALPDTGVSGGVEGGVAGGVEGGVQGGVEGGTVGGELGGQVGGVVGGAVEAPPPPSEPVRVGGNIKEPKKLRNIPPVYPDVAKQARVQGVVVLEATIDTSGRVDNVRVLRGIPLLNEAAVDAVKKWVYSPTMLNGTPVPVIMTVTVNFTLG
jgi:periplasmic protein TonB